MPNYRMNLMLCAGTGCVSNKSFELKDALAKRDLADEIRVVATGCQGFCAQGPIVLVEPEGIFCQLLRPSDVPHLVEEHFVKGRPVEKLMYKPAKDAHPIPNIGDIGFFKKQQLVALANRGIIDPESIDEYIARGGYTALAKAMTEMTSEEIIAEVKSSGLRGRGGAGFPTGQKWEFARNAEGDVKYVICNADEGDLGAFMDRSVVESDPHAVLEGMAIGAYAIGASKGFVYIRDEYPLATMRIGKAIEDATEYGLLGENIFGTDFSFKISVNRGAGAFVCGEETSLIAKEVYGADGVSYSPAAEAMLKTATDDPEMRKLGTCMVKTHLSLSHDPALKGRPKGWTLPIRDVQVYMGAGFIVPIAGDIKLMPGTASDPAFRRIDVDVETGKVRGLF